MTQRYPDGHVFYRKLRRDYPRIVRGEGCWLWDDAGNKYLDACGGAFVCNVGHGVSEIADAIAEQARTIAYVSGMTFTHAPVEELAAELAELAPGDLETVYFLSSGSEATEAALKLARQYWAEQGLTTKRKIIAPAPGYHGNTLLALSASAREPYRRLFPDWLVDVVRIPAPYAYRCECRGESAVCPTCTGDVLEDTILRERADTIAAFIAEPIGGASTGASVPRADYWRNVRAICDRHQVLFIADEVLTGAGRTGRWSALEHFDVVPDILTMGKGIAGGYVPLSAVIAPRRIVDVIAGGSGALLHAQTFSHHPVACAAGRAVLRMLREDDLVSRCARMGTHLHQALARLLEHPHVGDVRGLGLLGGIELVADKTTRLPFARESRVAESVAAAAEEDGLVVWANTGHTASGNGDLLLVAPPFTIEESEVEEIVCRLEIALDRVFAPTATR